VGAVLCPFALRCDVGTVHLSEAVSRYLESLAAGRRSPLYLNVLRSTFRQWLRAGDPPLSDAARDINAYLAQRLAPLSHNSAVQEFHRVRQFLDYGVAERWLERNPLRGLRAPRPQTVEIDVLSDDELRRLLEAGDHIERVIIMVLLGSGMRLGELGRLTWGDIHGDELLLHGKGGKERRVAPGRIALAALYSLPRTGDAVLPFKVSNLKRRLKNLSERTHIHFHAHVLRHTFADRFIAAGGTVEELSFVLGHSNLQTTMIYIRRHQRDRALEAQRRLNPCDTLLGHHPQRLRLVEHILKST
jgi:integrase